MTFESFRSGALAVSAGLALTGLLACGDGTPGDNEGSAAPTKHQAVDDGGAHQHEKGPHGGETLHVGTGGGHVEFAHDLEAKRVDLWTLGADAKTDAKVATPPALNLLTNAGPKRLESRPVGGGADGATHFAIVDDALGAEWVSAQIAITVKGKAFFAALPTHSHGAGGHAHQHAENAISQTVWTKTCEWFVELEAPTPGKPAAFAAHVTRLADFKPATTGHFDVQAISGEATASTSADKPARPGIYTPKITFPSAGEWTVTLEWKDDARTDRMTWKIEVCDSGHAHGQEAKAPAGAISFLKEQQWQIPFATALAVRRDVGDSKGVIAVPTAAVHDHGGEGHLVEQLSGESFLPRKVQLGKEADGWVEITGGLAEGARVVTRGAGAVEKAAR